MSKNSENGGIFDIASIGPKIKPSIKHFFRFYQIRFLSFQTPTFSKNASNGNDCHVIKLSPL